MSGITVITGGAGFLGFNLALRLAGEGRDVVLIDDLTTPGAQERIGSTFKIEKSYGLRPHGYTIWHNHSLASAGRICFFEEDLLSGIGSCFQHLMSNGKIDEIYHLASPASPSLYKKNPVRTLAVNTQALLNLLQIAHFERAKIFFASSSEVYGKPSVFPTPESYNGNVSCTGPRSCYDEGKRAGEAFCVAQAAERETEVRIGRIHNTFGPWQAAADRRLVPSLIWAALNDAPFEVHGTGEQKRSLCFVDDTISGILAVMKYGGRAEPYNIGSTFEYSINELVVLVENQIGMKIDVRYMMDPQDKDDPVRRLPDLHKIRSIGWSGPNVGVPDGIQRTIEWMRNRDERGSLR